MTLRKLLLGTAIAIAMFSPALANDGVTTDVAIERLGLLEITPITCVSINAEFPRVSEYQHTLAHQIIAENRYNEVSPVSMKILDQLIAMPLEGRYQWCADTRKTFAGWEAQLPVPEAAPQQTFRQMPDGQVRRECPTGWHAVWARCSRDF